jgi:hypothetical protein
VLNIPDRHFTMDVTMDIGIGRLWRQDEIDFHFIKDVFKIRK